MRDSPRGGQDSGNTLLGSFFTSPPFHRPDPPDDQMP